MSAQPQPRLIKTIATEPIGDSIRLTDEVEATIRRVVQEELREFMLAERRAARLIDAFVVQKLGLIT